MLVGPTEPADVDAVGAPLTLRAYVARSGATLLLVAGAIFAMFLPCVTVPYAFGDDYAKLWMAVSRDPNPWFGKTVMSADSSELRPLTGFLSQIVLGTAGTVDNLRFVRLLAIVGIVGLALLLHWALVRSRVPSAPAALIAVFVCSMPSFQVVASWAVLFGAPYAAMLGAGASLLATSGSDLPKRPATDRLAQGAVLLVAGLLIYQPAVMFFWIFFAVALVGVTHDSARAFRVARAHAIVAVSGLGLAFVIAKTIAHLVGYQTANTSRSELTHDVVGKARWFVTDPLPRSLSLFELRTSSAVVVVVVVVAAAGMALWLRRRASRPLLFALVAVSLVPLAFLPNLMVKEDNSYTFRTGIALTSLLALYACFGALGLWMAFRELLRPRVNPRAFEVAGYLALGVATVFVAATAVIASHNVTTLMVQPQNTELRIMRSQVATLPLGVPRVAFVQIGWNQGMTDWYSDELGLASSARPWTGPPAVYLLLHEQGRLNFNQPRPTIDWLPGEAPLAAPGAAEIDVRTALGELR